MADLHNQQNTQNEPIVFALQSMRVASLEAVHSATEHVTFSQLTDLPIDHSSGELKIMKEKINDFEESFANYENLLENHPTKDSLSQEIRWKWNELLVLINQVVDLPQQDLRQVAIAEKIDELKQTEYDLFELIDTALQNERQEIKKLNAIITNEITTHIIFTILLAAITGFVVIVLGKKTSDSITKPINYIREATRKIAHGNITQTFPNKFANELDELAQDISKMGKEIQESHDQKVKSEKMVAIGQLSARLAHDLRNPLSILQATIEIMQLRNKTTSTEKDQKDFERMNRSIDRINNQIEDVLNFVRVRPTQRQDVTLSSIVNDSLELLKIPEEMKIIKPTDDVTINCDKKQIEVVMVNLIKNGIESIPDNGTITINYHDSKENHVIEVQDSGKGIPEDKIDKIFEPLFTTKKTGTGLGLVSCKNIIENHGGTLTVHNNPTTFSIILPKKIKTEFDTLGSLDKKETMQKH